MKRCYASLDAATLRELFSYDPEAGEFTYLKSRGNRAAGQVTRGTPSDRGYFILHINGRDYPAGRLAWLYMTGEWPLGVVDHKNTDTGDNRWTNLRDVPQPINLQNQRRAHCQNKTGLLGVHAHKGGFFTTRITVAKERHYLGSFATAQEAHAAYLAAKRRLHEGCTL